jgi:hypothetical protein
MVTMTCHFTLLCRYWCKSVRWQAKCLTVKRLPTATSRQGDRSPANRSHGGGCMIIRPRNDFRQNVVAMSLSCSNSMPLAL